MTFSDDLQTDLDSVFYNSSEFADLVTVADASTSVSNVPALRVANQKLVDDFSSRQNVRFETWRLNADDVSTVTIQRGVTRITDSDGVVWYATNVVLSPDFDGEYQLTCKAAQVGN